MNGEPHLTWDLVEVVRQSLEFPFMVNAYRAGAVVAVLAGTVGWFMVLRRETFAGHTLAVVGFPGAAGAVLIGLSAHAGLFAFCVVAAVVIAVAPRRSDHAGEQAAVIAIVQAFALACGFLFASLSHGRTVRINNLLFGTFLGVTAGQVRTLAVIAAVALALVALAARPLLFVSIDPDVAEAAGVPNRVVSTGFAIVLGLAAAEASTITGALLVLALLVLPAATAQTMTSRPVRGVLLSIAIATAVTWAGLGAAYYSPYPIGFWVTSIAFAAYVTARVALPGQVT